MGGYGGQGRFSGGGGGADGVNGFPDFGRGGAGGGGGGSYINTAAVGSLINYTVFDGFFETPGNANDPDRGGAGQGGVNQDGTKGRVVVRYNTVQPLQELTTLWKAVGTDTGPVDVVFQSPAELDSAQLEITDPDGVAVTFDPRPLEVLSSEKLWYRLRWQGPWAGLSSGDYGVTVRASDRSGVTLSSEPVRVHVVASAKSAADVR